MGAVKPKRRHHVNAQFYLREFQCSEDEDCVWVYDKDSGGEAKKVPIIEAAVQKDYYSFVNSDGLPDTELIENFLADVEGHAATVFRKYVETTKLSDEERMNFAISVALFFARSPAARRQIAEVIAMRSKMISHISSTDPERFRKSYRQMEGHNSVPEEDRLSDEEIEKVRQFMLGGEYEFAVADHMTLLPLARLTEIGGAIFHMTWTRVCAPKGEEFITSDSPVVRDVSRKNRDPLTGPGFANPDIQVSLPLSPRIAWFASWNEDMPEELQITREHVKAFNLLRAFHSERHLYSSTYRPDVSKLAARCQGSGYKLAASGFGFKGRETIEAKQFKVKSAGIAPSKQTYLSDEGNASVKGD